MATEEQTSGSVTTLVADGDNIRTGQQVTISNRIVSKLSFPLKKKGSPTGDVTLTIRKVSDDSVLANKVWGNASSLTTNFVWREVTFDSPVLINEEVRILVEFSGGSAYDDVVYSLAENSDVKADEFYTRYKTSWSPVVGWDHQYIYTYEPAPAAGRSFGYIMG